jgi:cysteine-rich repeat protein
VITPAAAAAFKLEGGKICFDTIDCVAWGNYAPVDGTVGTPFQFPVGLDSGKAMKRRLDVAGSPTILEATDDTNNCANDFRPGAPTPRNNAGVNGTPPVSVCQNNVLEGLEECDDGNPVADDACNATCSLTRVFADGFETGNISRWHSALMGSSTDLTVTGAAALQGSFGLQGVVNDTEGLYVQNDSPTDESRYRVRFRFDPNGFDPGEAQSHFRTRILIAFDETPTQRRLLAVVLRRIAGQYAIMGRARRDDNSQANTGFTPIGAGAHWVQLDWRRSTGPDALDGRLEMWVDGTSVSTLTGLDNSISAVDFVRLGALSVKAGAAGTLRWDHFESRREFLIGP